MFPDGFRALGLGKVIGMPTMGAVIGTGAFGLLDGSRAVQDAIAPYAEACDVEPAQAQTELLGFVREALARGLLRVAPREPVAG